MSKNIFPPKIVDGYASPWRDGGYQLKVNEQSVGKDRYEKYKHNIALQDMWDKCLRQQRDSYGEYEVKQKSLKSVKTYISNFYKQCFEGDPLFAFVSQSYSCVRYHHWYEVSKDYHLKLYQSRQV